KAITVPSIPCSRRMRSASFFSSGLGLSTRLPAGVEAPPHPAAIATKTNISRDIMARLLSLGSLADVVEQVDRGHRINDALSGAVAVELHRTVRVERVRAAGVIRARVVKRPKFAHRSRGTRIDAVHRADFCGKHEADRRAREIG